MPKENEIEMVIESQKPKIEGIFKKKDAEQPIRVRQVQFDITDTQRNLQS